DAARLTATRIVARARGRLAEGDALAELAVFLERPVREPLLVAQLHPAQVQHAVLHGAVDLLAEAALGPMIERRDDAEGEVQARAGITDLRARHHRDAVP